MSLDNQTLMFIGAGPAQIEGINTARKMGFVVLAIDGNPSAEGFKLADKFLHLDIFKFAEIIDVARKEQVVAAISIASEICLESVARVNEALGVPALSLEKSQLAVNKGLMRVVFENNDIAGPAFRVVSDVDSGLDFTSSTGYPVVVKPVDASGSKGVSWVDNSETFEAAFMRAAESSRSGQVILEEFMEGDEIAIEAFVIDGQVHILTLSDKTRTSVPYMLDTSVTFPSDKSAAVQDEARNLAIRAISALGLDNCPIHMELMVTAAGVKIVEVAARGAGFNVYTHIVPHVTGVDPVAIQLDLILGNNPQILRNTTPKGACIRFFSGAEGVLSAVAGLEKARAIEGVFDMAVYPAVGDRIRDLTCGADRIGHVITFGVNRSDAVRIAERAVETIEFTIERDANVQ